MAKILRIVLVVGLLMCTLAVADREIENLAAFYERATKLLSDMQDTVTPEDLMDLMSAGHLYKAVSGKQNEQVCTAFKKIESQIDLKDGKTLYAVGMINKDHGCKISSAYDAFKTQFLDGINKDTSI